MYVLPSRFFHTHTHGSEKLRSHIVYVRCVLSSFGKHLKRKRSIFPPPGHSVPSWSREPDRVPPVENRRVHTTRTVFDVVFKGTCCLCLNCIMFSSLFVFIIFFPRTAQRRRPAGIRTNVMDVERFGPRGVTAVSSRRQPTGGRAARSETWRTPGGYGGGPRLKRFRSDDRPL